MLHSGQVLNKRYSRGDMSVMFAVFTKFSLHNLLFCCFNSIMIRELYICFYADDYEKQIDGADAVKFDFAGYVTF